jgi:hypothetical protein
MAAPKGRPDRASRWRLRRRAEDETIVLHTDITQLLVGTSARGGLLSILLRSEGVDPMSTTFKIGDQVRWNFVLGQVCSKIIHVHKGDTYLQRLHIRR